MNSRKIVLCLLMMIMAACQQNDNTENPVVVPTLIMLPSATETPIPTPTATATSEPTIPPTATPIPTETASPSASSTPQPSATVTPTLTLAPTITNVPSETPSGLFEEAAVQINRQNLMRTIADLTTFSTRHANSILNNGTTGIDAARAYLTGIMQQYVQGCAAPAQFFQDIFALDYQGISTQQMNLVVLVEGTDATRGIVVVGAHYDTYSKDNRFNALALQPGADDNGSGVSATLELLRLICLAPRTQSMAFVLFAAEEVRPEGSNTGRVGSRHFVRNFITLYGWNVAAMLNLDTIGSATDTSGAIVDDFARLYSRGPVDGASRRLARQIQAAAAYNLPNFSLQVENREDRENRWGDHMSFTEVGYPAVRLFEASEDVERQDSRQDVLNDIDPAYLENNVRVALAFLLGFSDGAFAPTSIQVSGNTASWNAVPEAEAYLVVGRSPGASNYTFSEVVTTPSLTLPANTIFAIASIRDGVVGRLSAENFIP